MVARVTLALFNHNVCFGSHWCNVVYCDPLVVIFKDGIKAAVSVVHVKPADRRSVSDAALFLLGVKLREKLIQVDLDEDKGVKELRHSEEVWVLVFGVWCVGVGVHVRAYVGGMGPSIRLKYVSIKPNNRNKYIKGGRLS